MKRIEKHLVLSMLIYAKTQSKKLIDKFSNLVLCVFYDRIMTISIDLANNVCTKFHEDQVVCTLNLLNRVLHVVL